MSAVKRFIHEVHRRSLWQVLGIYLAAAWVAIQVVETITDGMGLPDWVMPFAVVLLVIGLPIVLATAFVQEGVTSGRATAGEAAPTDRRGTGPAAAGEAGEQVAAKRSEGAVGATGEVAFHHRLFTWRNAVLGGVGAFALLGVLTAGYMAMRVLGVGPAGTLVAKGVLEEREPILLAEFEDQTGDPSLAAAVTEALRIDLAQSPTVTLLSPDELSDALRRMQRDPEAPIDHETAREVAIREGVKAIVAGEVGTLGGAYVLSARLEEAESGEILVPLRETAADSSRIIEAVDALSRRLRERIGESLRSVQAKEPLKRVTTASLAALRKYSQGLRAVRAGERLRGIQFYQEAIALDSGFSQAYLDLAVELNNMGRNRGEQLEALSRAYHHRERLPDPERYFVEATYHGIATGESQRAIDAYRSLLDVAPDHEDALNDLAIEYTLVRNYEEAAELLRAAIERRPEVAVQYANLANVLAAVGDTAAARAQIDRLAERLPEHPSLPWFRSRLDYLVGDREAARSRLLEAREEARENPALWGQLMADLVRIAGVEGRIGGARAYLAEALDRLAASNEAAEHLERQVEFSGILLEAGQRAKALSELDRALERFPLDSLSPFDRPSLSIAILYARADLPDRARSLIERFERDVPEEFRGPQRPPYHAARGFVALAEGRAEDAVEEMRRSDVRGCRICALPGLGAAYDSAGRRDSTIAVYERYVAASDLTRTWMDPQVLPGILERLASLYEERGDLESAAKYYARFVELWADADPELQPRVRAAQERLEEIVAQRG